MSLKEHLNFANQHLKIRIGLVKRSIFTYGFLIFILFLAFSFTGLYLFRNNTLKNADSVSMEMATHLSIRSISVFERQKQLIETASWFTYDKLWEAQMNNQEVDLVQWLRDCRILLEKHFDKTQFDLYASINNKIVAANFWHGDEQLDVTSRPWYREAIKHRGQAVILDPYVDIYTGHQVVTISCTIGESNDVFVCDIYPEISQITEVQDLLLKGYAYFLIDKNGSLITFAGTENHNYREIQDFIDRNFIPELQRQGKLSGMHYTDLQENRLHVVSYRDPVTGWYSILTAKYDTALAGYERVKELFLILLAAFFVIECAMLYREYRLSRQMEINNETLKVLANSYETIVRINFRTGKFTTLKAHREVIEFLSKFPTDRADTYEVLLKYLTEHICPEFRQSFEENYSLNSITHYALNRVRDVGHDYRFEVIQGQPMWYNVRILYDESLDLVESVLSFKMVDDEKMQELAEQQLLREALENSRRLEQSRNTFFASISHDMRTPLNGIIGLCRLIFAQKGKNFKEDYINDTFKKIESSSKQLLHLVDDVLEISRPDQDKPPQQLPFKLKESLVEALDVFKMMAVSENKHFNVSIDIEHNLVKGDFPLIRQVINNLLSNAFKYSAKGARIDFKLREIVELEGKTKYILEVADTGIGMSENFMSRIFLPYERELRLKDVPGTGLGLVIVKSIVNRLNGDIRVTSKLDEGTVFTVIIPLDVLDESVDLDKTSSTPQEESEEQVDFNIKGLKILLAEDNELNMEITSDMLELRGIDVVRAYNGKEAVEAFKNHPQDYFDAILLDMRMPVMDGCEAAQAIRALGGSYASSIPMIAVTANAFAEDIAATAASGMNAHVAKPIDFNILERTLARLVTKFYEEQKKAKIPPIML